MENDLRIATVECNKTDLEQNFALKDKDKDKDKEWKKTHDVLYFRKAEGARISNMSSSIVAWESMSN